MQLQIDKANKTKIIQSNSRQLSNHILTTNIFIVFLNNNKTIYITKSSEINQYICRPLNDDDGCLDRSSHWMKDDDIMVLLDN
jgi:hypothetical protein